MKKELSEKYNNLISYLKSLESVAVAFSGGVDSTFLLYAARKALGDNAVAVTAVSGSFPERERKEATEYCKKEGIRHFVIESEELHIEGFAQNPKNRCYLCKRELFEKMIGLAKEQNIKEVLEGSNIDDNGDYRPGLIAVKELGVKSPLRIVNLTKGEIRELSKEFGLPTWDKPSFACLSSRFPYGETITEEKLGMVDKAEQLLMDLGFRQLRVRIHGLIARIELLPEDFPRFMEESIRLKVYHELQEMGFVYIALDIRGYRTGSMNEVLTSEEKQQKGL
ncbi:MAG: ATP-dependent sacrificial sulfur transferase LarE [Lachnospiraceae bacterium]|nr:ATP-dependent sacrificial sulfur transferase LarE [Lachnospiraceae bacterium]